MQQSDQASGLHSLIHNEDHDALTGLLTHQAFRSLVSKRLCSGQLAPSSGATSAVVYFNIENFKHYNQRYGFAQGDILIQHVGRSISSAFPGCPAARFSADQFVVLANRDDIEAGAKQVRQEFRKEHKDSSIWLRVGWYAITDEDNDADLACDRAKMACDDLRGRRDLFMREYDRELKRHIVWHRYVLDHFDEALEKGWIRAWCQPIVRVATAETCDVEALARWIDPQEGTIPPSEFIPVLEEARVVHLMDLAIIRDVCRMCHELTEQGRPFIPVSVNLSRLDFELCDIVTEICEILDEYAIPRSALSVEVTESALTGNAEFLKGEIDRFRSEGIAVWMDDFGSGYSSLNVLKDYTFDLVKIDMGFLRGFEHTEQSRIMLAKIIDLGKELGLKMLVEGVETKEQYEFIRSLGCERAQGWLFGKPSPLPDSIEGIANDAHSEVELLAKREFYEAGGRVNLMRPDPKTSFDGHYLPSDVACAIIRCRNGHYEYLNYNSLYLKVLHDIGVDTVEEYELIINEPGNIRAKNMVSLIERCSVSDNWEYYFFARGENAFIVRMKRISQIEEFGAVALLTVVDELADIDW